jgi:integrase
MESSKAITEPAGVAVRAGRGRPALSAGKHGEITTASWVKDVTTDTIRRKRPQGDSRRPVQYWTAEAYLRVDGKSRPQRLQARGKSEGEATAKLEAKLSPPETDHLAEALSADGGHGSNFTNKSTLGEVLDGWVNDSATIAARSVGTMIRYRHCIDSTIKARRVGTTTLGAAPLDRVTPRVVTLFLQSLTPAVAKAARGILRQALTFAVANGATVPTTNGAFAMLSQRIERGQDAPVEPTVAITMAESEQIIADLSTDDQTKGTNLPDLFRFLAGTGCRTSEATALAWIQLDLDNDEPTVLINATVNAAGKRQPHTKTRAGTRRLALPPVVVEMLKARRAANSDEILVFPSDAGTPYWTSNITGVIRGELDRLGHDGVTARSFRKMVATEMDKAGFTPREIADQLGHARPSVTMDVYQNREAKGPMGVAGVLT